MKKLVFYCLFVGISFNINAQNKHFSLMIIPQTENNLCDVFEEAPQKREVTDAVSHFFNTQNINTANFIAFLQQIKRRGVCDGYNPQKPLSNILSLSQVQAYIIAEYKLKDENMQGRYKLLLNLSLYDVESRNLLAYWATSSDNMPNKDLKMMTKNAMEKIKENLILKIQENYQLKAKPAAIQTKVQVVLTSDVDSNLPQTNMPKHKGIAVVIGNRDYSKTKEVAFALHDAQAMKKYLIEVLGFEEGNILYTENALKSDFEQIFGIKGNAQGKLFNAVSPQESEVFIFYSGHGGMGLNDKATYFIPVDCNPQYIELNGFATQVFYENLAQIPAKNFTIVLDACFSGIDLYQNISPVRIKSKGAAGLANAVILAASQSDEVAGWYNEKQHGLLTYYFLKAIHAQNADKNKDKKLSWQEIYNFIADRANGLPFMARKLHNITQNPMLKADKPQDKILVRY